MRTKLIIEQHFHGCFGIDFNKATVDDVLFLSKEILKHGIGGIFPTLVTDSVENIKRAISVIKEAKEKQTPDMANILGIHLEGIFINPEKKGIHNPAHFLAPTVENYKLVADDFIKIVTLAPELIPLIRPSDTFSHAGEKAQNLIEYLSEKGVKVQAGHCVGGDLTGCAGVTHLFNAMSGVAHRGETTALSALVDDNIYTEIIGDGIHVSDKALELVFKCKPLEKIILISDSLPCTNYNPHSLSEGKQLLMSGANVKDVGAGEKLEFVFADEKVYYDGIKATSKDGTIAGSTTMIPKIIKRLVNGIFSPSACTLSPRERGGIVSQLIQNPYNYHNIDIDGSIEWDEDFNIIKVNK